MSDNHDIPTNDNALFTPNQVCMPFSLASTTIAGGKGKMTVGITFTKDYGKNLVISDKLYKAIGSPEQAQAGIIDGKFAIGEVLHEFDVFYSMRNQKKHKVIYNTVLINAIVGYFNLDYSNCTRKTFDNVEIVEMNVNNTIVKVALVTMEDKK